MYLYKPWNKYDSYVLNLFHLYKIVLTLFIELIKYLLNIFIALLHNSVHLMSY